MVQLYTFSEGKGLVTRNLLDSAPFSEMVIAGRDYFAGKDQDYPQWVGGRWPGKPALRIGTMVSSIGRTHFYGVAGTDFTLELWVRTTFPAQSQERVVLASVGDGVSNGWRLVANGFGIDFVLGRPAGQGEGQGPVVVRTGDVLLPPHVWHQVAGVVNGKTLQLYVDGKLAGAQGFDGIYRHSFTPASRHQVPEIDTRGGLQVGSTASHKSTGTFDLDELAIFSRALDAAEIAGFYATGSPDATPEAQAQRHLDELAHRALLDGIAIDLPKDTFGYFPNAQPIPVTVTIAEASTGLFGNQARVDVEVKRFMGEVLAAESRAVAVTPGAPAKVEYAIQPDRCGLYELTVTARDAEEKVIKSARFLFAMRLPLPARENIPASAMFASYAGLNAETPSFGTSAERIIQPIFGRAKDGTPNYATSDALVDTCVSMGLDVLYCISIGFWEAGRYKTVDDWKADPRVHTDHVRALATRYKGKVKYWEIFNEPNAGHPHGMTPAVYVPLLKQAHEIIKDVDPAAQVVGPCGTSQYHEWTEAVLAAGGGQYLDILSFHNYIGRSPLANRELGRVEAVRESMRKHIGRVLPMWNSECGIHQPGRIDGRPATDDELLKLYGGRARRTRDGVQVSVDAIMMTNEHLSACWQVQSLLVERADGVEKYFMLMRASQPYPGFSPGDQFVTEKGVALAAVQSVLVETTAARFIPTNVTGTACVALTDRRGQTSVALFADRPVSLVFRAAATAGVTFKGMDYLGNPRSFTTGEAGLLALELSSEPVYLFAVPDSFAINAQGVAVTCAHTQLEPMTRVEVPATICNPYDRPINAALEVTVSAGLATPQAKELKLAPKETRTVPIVWQTGGMEKGKHWLRVQYHVDAQFFAVVEAGDFFSHGTMTRIHRLSGAFRLDGDTAKWADMPAQAAMSPAQAVIGRPVEGAPSPAFWSGPDDLSYTLKTAWTDAGIHFLVTVTDNILRPPMNAEEDKQPYLFDGLELFVDVRPLERREAALTAGAVQAVVAPRLGDAAAACPVRIFGKEPFPVVLECVSRKHGGGYVVEGTIAPVDGSPLKLQDGTQINLDVSVDDNDDRPDQTVKLGRRIQMALHGTAANNTTTTDYGRYTLSADSPRPNLVRNGAFTDSEPLPPDARAKSDVNGWRMANAEALAPAARDATFWGVKRVDGRTALWLGTAAEAHIEPCWDVRIPVKETTGYSVSCLQRGRVDGKAEWASCNAGVMFFDSKGGFIGHRSLGGLDIQKVPDQWRAANTNFVTPAGTASIGFRAGILSKGVTGFADYFWTDIAVREMPERTIPEDVVPSELGRRLSRTMAALATSTAKERKTVRVLFYGQSITAQEWSHRIGKRLQDKYFAADFSFSNRAIGGFSAERLIKTAKHDLYPDYPDLVVFHVYGGQTGEWEQIIREIRTRTTAEILVATHHLSHQGNKWVETEHDKESAMIRSIAEKYDCELVDVRKEWAQHLKENKLEIKDLLRDDIHLNDKGCELMESLIWKHLQYNPGFETPHAQWVRRIPVQPAADGAIKVEFTGNRVDIVADTPVANMGTARLLVDGQPPSANPLAYAVTRPSIAPGVWWPAVYTVGSDAPLPQVETWTLKITDVPDTGFLKFSVTGGKTGPDGAGNTTEPFVSNSKRVVIDPNDFGFAAAEKYTKTKCPVGFEVKWEVVPMFVDTYEPPPKFDPTRTNNMRVVQLIDNGPHTLEIIPNGNGPVPIKEIIAHEPPLRRSGESNR
ncbi:MAG: hypothetical protein A3K19_10920 [Lentisphaerae bacterium RIFOXYB12_FULL_65_16]|nr:MAG: hypothetical protein A3K18_18125 [Lentisphaerae bacterium RIFOXYA12_64_32]OGV87854.1 MAG: hypothetical protein A3K19_10920 [Lentisphaerae bacterium RIFOXYB12_FULL_65_16]